MTELQDGMTVFYIEYSDVFIGGTGKSTWLKV